MCCRARLKLGSGKVHLRRLDTIWVCGNINPLQWFANLQVTSSRALHASTTFGRPNLDGVISRVGQELAAGGYAEGVDKAGRIFMWFNGLGEGFGKYVSIEYQGGSTMLIGQVEKGSGHHESS